MYTYTGGDVEHGDGLLALNVIPVPQAAKLLLTSGASVPDVEPDGASASAIVCYKDEYNDSIEVLIGSFPLRETYI